jgi:hypothetical protein
MRSEHVVKRHDLRQSVCDVRGRLRMHAGDGRLQAVGPEPPRRERPSTSAMPSAIDVAAPKAAVLVLQEDYVARRRGARRRRDSCNSMRASIPMASGSGSSSTRRRASGCLHREIGARARAPDDARIPFVEDEDRSRAAPRRGVRRARGRRALRTECARRGSSPWRARCAARASAPARGRRARSPRSSGRRPRAA